MTIETVKDIGLTYEVTLLDGTLIWVPKDAENADYGRVQTWVADGGTITS